MIKHLTNIDWSIIHMPYTHNGKINLNDYHSVKELSNGKTNKVYLWEHNHDSNLKIVVKIPNEFNTDLIQHNIRTINSFFGKDSAWPIEGTKGFAMKYYQGSPLTPEEEDTFVNNKHSSIRTINKNGLLFTLLNPNKDNFLKLSTGAIIPIDFDYMIVNDGKDLLPYQKIFLDIQMNISVRLCDATVEEATQHILNSYPAVKSYLHKHWGKQYITRLEDAPVRRDLATLLQIEKMHKIPTPTELNFNNKLALLGQKIAYFRDKPECENARKAASILYLALSEEGEKYFGSKQSKKSYQIFKDNCQAHIKTARIELDQHRGWTKILLNILGVILSAGVGYAIAAGINIAMNKGKFTFFAPDSSIKINAIEESIHQAAPAA